MLFNLRSGFTEKSITQRGSSWKFAITQSYHLVRANNHLYYHDVWSMTELAAQFARHL